MAKSKKSARTVRKQSSPRKKSTKPKKTAVMRATAITTISWTVNAPHAMVPSSSPAYVYVVRERTIIRSIEQLIAEYRGVWLAANQYLGYS